MPLSRRRFLTLSAALAAAGPARAAAPLRRFRARAMGSAASLLLAHPQAPALAARVWAEVERLEGVFSLHRPDSALSRLNATGRLDAPPFELLGCLSLCAAVHRASGGAFDPTVQPLWALHALRQAEGRPPSAAEIAAVLPRTGWDGVRFDEAQVRLARPGMALTLNGVAQGLVADRVAALLGREGLTDVLIDMGEIRAPSGRPDGAPWTVALRGPGGPIPGPVPLRAAALATSAPLGTTFDEEGRSGHILDPRTGEPVAARWRSATITAPEAGLADALSTAACGLAEAGIAAMLAAFPGAAAVRLLAA